jgi:hypothetical protein
MFTKATRRIPTDGVAVFDAPHRRSPVVTVMAWPMIVRRKRRGSGGFGEARKIQMRLGVGYSYAELFPPKPSRNAPEEV